MPPIVYRDAVSPDNGAETISLSADAPLLVSPSERLWGANAILPASVLPQGKIDSIVDFAENA